MKYSTDQGRISCFVVGRAGSEHGLPMAVFIYKAGTGCWVLGTGCSQ
ncbi:hypothetical protein [Desulfocicer vacuolatum]|nr:hypothetical protein [Desulfocicer vacuolatum]